MLVPEFMEFIKLKTLPVVGLVSEENFRRYEATGRTVLTAFTSLKDPLRFGVISESLRLVAKGKIAKDMLFNVADID